MTCQFWFHVKFDLQRKWFSLYILLRRFHKNMSYLAIIIHQFVDWDFYHLVEIIFWLRLFVEGIVHPWNRQFLHYCLPLICRVKLSQLGRGQFRNRASSKMPIFHNFLPLISRVKLWQLWGQFGNILHFTNTWAWAANFKGHWPISTDYYQSLGLFRGWLAKLTYSWLFGFICKFDLILTSLQFTS